LVNGIGSGGDVIAVIWVLFQVPQKATICFSGGKAYWRLISLPNPLESSRNTPNPSST
jgi:hypothetical protein